MQRRRSSTTVSGPCRLTDGALVAEGAGLAEALVLAGALDLHVREILERFAEHVHVGSRDLGVR